MKIKISDVCSHFGAGSSITAKDIHKTGKYPVYGANGIRGYTNMYNFEGSCALIGRQGAECGNVHYFSGKAFISEHAIIAEANTENNSKFLANKLALMKLNRYQGQSAQPGLSAKTIGALDITMPSLKVQKKIAFLLENIDQKIVNNNAISKELKSMAKTIYDYWFLQFEFPDKDGKPYKSNGGKMVWNDQLKQNIPEGWKSTTVGNITINHDSKRIPVKQTDRAKMVGNIPYYGATGIMGYVDHAIFDGDYVLLAEDGTVMDANGFPIVQRITGKTWVNNHTHVLEPKCGYHCKLLMLILKYIPVIKIKTGSVQMKINQENLNTYPIINIPQNIKNKANKILDAIDLQILHNEKENRELKSLRDFLLPMLMNGQITITD